MNKKQRTALNKKKKAERPVIPRASHGKVWKGIATHETRRDHQQRNQLNDMSNTTSQETSNVLTTYLSS